MTDAIFRTTCARCAAPLEVTDATADAVVKAHEERCVVTGDYARWWPIASDARRYVDGRILSNSGAFLIQSISGPTWSTEYGYIGSIVHLAGYPVGTTRRIHRPEQAADSLAVRIAKRAIAAIDEPCTGTWIHAELLIYHCSQECGHPGNCYDAPPLRSEPIGYEAPIRFDAGPSRPARSVKVDPLDVLYDCETLRSLLMLDEANLRGEGEMRTDGKLWMFTPAQRTAVSLHWSAELRAKIAASKERERLTVVIEQDCDGDPW